MKIILSLLLAIFCVTAEAKTIKLTTMNTVNFRGPVDWDSITSVKMKLIEKVKKRKGRSYPIYLVMDSPGGSIAAGESFIEFTRSFKNLHTISLFAASMASAIVESLPGKRYITYSGIMMFHRASGTFKGNFETGEVESQIKFWKSLVRNMEARNANRLGIKLSAYKQKVVHEWWEVGYGAKDQNMVDEVVSVVCSEALVDSREDGAVRGFFGSSTALFSGCPLIQNPLP